MKIPAWWPGAYFLGTLVYLLTKRPVFQQPILQVGGIACTVGVVIGLLIAVMIGIFGGHALGFLFITTWIIVTMFSFIVLVGMRFASRMLSTISHAQNKK